MNLKKQQQKRRKIKNNKRNNTRNKRPLNQNTKKMNKYKKKQHIANLSLLYNNFLYIYSKLFIVRNEYKICGIYVDIKWCSCFYIMV